MRDNDASPRIRFAVVIALASCAEPPATPAQAPSVATDETPARPVRCCDRAIEAQCRGTNESCCAAHGGDCDAVEMTFDAQDGSRAPTLGATVALATTLPPPAAGGDTITEVPSRNDVIATMRAVSASIAQCPGAAETRTQVTIQFDANGRAVRGAVGAPVVGTALEACVLRALSFASVPPFTRPSFAVGFPVVGRAAAPPGGGGVASPNHAP